MYTCILYIYIYTALYTVAILAQAILAQVDSNGGEG
jgi:hypothetical protein